MRLLIILKFFLLINTAELIFLQDCPPKCQCLRGAVRCLHQDLVAVPKAPKEANTLDLRFNKIYDIAPGVFTHLHHLRSLLLNDNKIQELRTGVFHGLRKLKYLYVYRNKIKHIDSDVFHGLDNLLQLYLHGNEIHQIEPETFSHLPHLERLYLHSNQLKRIPPGSFRNLPMLQKLRLDSNALICDCSILWFVRMIAEHSDMNIAASCSEPANASGNPLNTMQPSDFNCKPPEIMTEPKDAFVSFGDDAKFSCVAIGIPEPHIVWFRDSIPLPLEGNSRYQIMDDGSLMVHDADETAVGVFECMAENAVGEARSKAANMILHSKPRESEYPVFTVLPQQKNTKLNEQVILDCVAKGNPQPHIIWLFNEERMLLNDRTTLHTNGSLVIENAKATDAGSYTCQAENVNGKIAVTTEIQVLLSPSLLRVPSDSTAHVGGKVEFTCTARGYPKPKISWFKNTMTLPTSDNIILSDDNQNLTLVDLTFEDAGLYHCRAENTEGLTEISAELKVEEQKGEKPQIIVKPEDTDAFKGTVVQFPCEIEGELDALIEWRKDGARIEPDKRHVISIIGSLIIKNVTLVDTGRYECSVFNEYGADAASAYLTVNDHTLPGDAYVNIALTEATRDIDQAIERTVKEMFSNDSKKGDIHELYRITRFPNQSARDVARAAEIYERTLFKVKQFIQAGLKVNSTRPFVYNNILSLEHLDIISRLSGCVAHREQKRCEDMCYHTKYRTFDGSCNNFDHPTWGSSLSAFRRILYPIYENGFSQPPGWNKDVKYNGFALPSARLVSTSIITTDVISQDVQITHMVMQWGQWLDHDIDHALPSVSSQTWDGIDCKRTCDYAAPCFPIDVPSDDKRIKNRRCIDFIRTSSVCGSGETSVLFGSLQPREQINQLTSFIDASQVYGFEQAVAEDLRDLTNENGLLRVGVTFPEKKPFLPTTGLNGMDCRRNVEDSDRNCFVAGDIRANEQIGLAAMHTIWMREHNRVALLLRALNPHWNGDKVYQEARKIVGAEIQYITYESWLPIVLGPEGYKQLGKYEGYNPNLNPSISNVFATAALRFGHSMINPLLHRYDENFETIPQGHLLLREAFFAPWRLVDEGGVDPLLRGMFTTPAKLKTPTQNLNSELTEQLFYSAHAVALDLAAINVQRGRDHGIPGYTKWRQVCNMTDVNDFEDLRNEISDPDIRNKLKTLYGSVHNIDVFVGGILEDQVEGGKVGPLFRCLLLEQFKRLRDGDRLWYENTMSPVQLHQIKQTSLARVLCDNGDNIDTIGENVFLLPEVQDGLISCDDMPSVDLRYWVDCADCENNDIGTSLRRTRRDLVDEKYQSLDNMKKSQIDLENAVQLLKKRIEFLEEQILNLDGEDTQ